MDAFAAKWLKIYHTSPETPDFALPDIGIVVSDYGVYRAVAAVVVATNIQFTTPVD
jgi:hypothetical protein